MFTDRVEAGRRLDEQLRHYQVATVLGVGK